MPPVPRFAVLLPLLCLSASGGALAQTPAEDPLYQVEIIVFAYRNADRYEEDFFHGRDSARRGPPPALLRLPAIELESVFGGRASDEAAVTVEVAPPEPTAAQPTAAADPIADSPSAADGLRLIEAFPDARGAGPGIRPAAQPPLPPGFRIAAADSLELTASASRLARAPYTLLGHVGWIQSGLDESRAVPIDLRQLGITNPPGTIELSVGRYLHVAVDLEYRDGSDSFWMPAPEAGLAPLVYAQSYRFVDESGPMRRNQVKLLDHPLLGVLVMIKAAPEPEEPASGDGTTVGPAG
jgi:hypothetical protein